MDLNVQPPAMWDLTLGPYEIAEYCVAQKTNLLILLNAWLDSKESPEEDTDWRTINYWALRLRPLWAKVVEADAKAEAEDADRSGESDSVSEDEGRAADLEGRKPGDELVVVVCNRCGEENGKYVCSVSLDLHTKSDVPGRTAQSVKPRLADSEAEEAILRALDTGV